MASRTLWSSFQLPVAALRGNLPFCYRRNQLRLSSLEVPSKPTRKGIFIKRGLWVLFGGGTMAVAAHNRLWERKQRRKLRVQVEGIGRFFR